MEVVESFFETKLLPLSICTLLGLCGAIGLRRQTFNYTMLFVVIVFLISVSWRLPIVKSTRYMLPLIVPMILLSTIFFKTLWSVHNWIGKCLCGIIWLIVIGAGAGKAMQVPEPKPYLRELPLVVNSDAERFGCTEKKCVIELGNPGGHIEFDKSVEVIQIYMGRDFDKNKESFLKILDAQKLHSMLLQRPVVYILLKTGDRGDVISELFRNRYHLSFNLCYEFKHPKRERRVLLYRILSPYTSGLLPEEARNTVYRKFNLLYNHDFGTRQTTSSGDSGSPNGGPKTMFPKGWCAELNKSCPNIAPGTISYAESGNLRLKSAGSVFLYQDRKTFPGRKRYQVRAKVIARNDTYFFIDVKQRRQTMLKPVRRILSQSLSAGEHELHESFDLGSEKDDWIFEVGISGGDIEIASLSLVEAEKFELFERQLKPGAVAAEQK